MYWGFSCILYTYDFYHNFGRASIVEKFNPPAKFSQFKHWCPVASRGLKAIKPEITFRQM